MHIGLFTDFYLPHQGGVETAVVCHAKALRARGHKVTVVCGKYKQYEHSEPGTLRLDSIRPFRFNAHPLIRVTAKNKAAVEAQLFDIVHVHTDQGAAALGVWLARKHHIPLFKTIHTNDLGWMKYNLSKPAKYIFSSSSRLYSILQSKRIGHPRAKSPKNQPGYHYEVWLLKKIFAYVHFAQAIVVPSKHFGEKLRAYYPDETYTVVPNSVDIHEFKPQYEDETKPVRIMWVGRASAEKRPMAFLEAIRLLRQSNSKPFTVDILGSGPELAHMRDFVRKNKLDCVTLHGGVPHAMVNDFYAKADIFAMTSYYVDTQAIVLAEAAASGLPIVLCDENLLEHVYPKGYYLAANEHPRAIADSLTPALRKKTPKTSQPIIAFAAQNYSLEVLGERLERLYAQS